MGKLFHFSEPTFPLLPNGNLGEIIRIERTMHNFLANLVRGKMHEYTQRMNIVNVYTLYAR